MFSVLNNPTETGELLAEYKVTYPEDGGAEAEQRHKKPKVTVNEVSEAALSLSILDVTPQDEGPYWCIVTVIVPVDSKSSEKVKLNITSK